MNKKKAKALRKIATAFIVNTGKPLEQVHKQYKKLKSIYKETKGEI